MFRPIHRRAGSANFCPYNTPSVLLKHTRQTLSFQSVAVLLVVSPTLMRIGITHPPWMRSQPVQRTTNARRYRVEHRGIDHRRPHLTAPEQLCPMRLRKTYFVVGALREPAHMGQKGHPRQDAQKGHPARPQGVGRLRRTQEGTSQGDTGLRTQLGAFFSILSD